MNNLSVRYKTARWSYRLFLPPVFLAISSPLFAYQNAEHQDVGTHARDNYAAYVQAHLDTSVGASALTIHWNDVAWGLLHEDDSPNYLEHFWDPSTGQGLPNVWPFPNYPSADTRAQNYWNSTDLFPAYRDGNYQLAYRTLGRVIHLAMDMGVPAHVNLDPHPVSDFYESTYITVAGHRVHSTTISTASALHTIMETLALASRNFDSDDRDGLVDLGARRAGGFTDAEGAGIAQVCYPGAEEAAGGIFWIFYDTVKPTVQIVRPVQAEIHSGLIGIPFEAKAHSYQKQFSDADFIQRVDFDYAEADTPATNDWTNAGNDTTPDGSSKYTYNWQNNLDDTKVWVRATALDDGDCESLREKAWIKIDSTRPTVTNTHPLRERE